MTMHWMTCFTVCLFFYFWTETCASPAKHYKLKKTFGVPVLRSYGQHSAERHFPHSDADKDQIFILRRGTGPQKFAGNRIPKDKLDDDAQEQTHLSSSIQINWITNTDDLMELLEDMENVIEQQPEPDAPESNEPEVPAASTSSPTPAPTPAPEPDLPTEVATMLNKHNALRRLAGAADMYEMTWNEELARMATVWSQRCQFDHGHPSSSLNYNPGQNLYMGSGAFDSESAIQMWYDEIKDYSYSSNSCSWGAVCGHYTQVVWANSKELGCGYHYCPHLMGMGAVLFTCNYGPPGNYVGQKPYITGAACSQCDTGDSCHDGLCVDQS